MSRRWRACAIWAAAAAMVALAAVRVHAAPASGGAQASFYRIQVPKQFSRQDGLSQTIADDVSHTGILGKLPFKSGADAYTVAGKAALYVSWIAATAPSADPAAAARRALDDLRASPQAGDVITGRGVDVHWQEHVRDNVAEGLLGWRHPSNETTTFSRVLAYASPARKLRVVKAECVIQNAALAAMRSDCESALASLAVVGSRAPLGSLPASRVKPVSGDLPALPNGGLLGGGPAGDAGSAASPATPGDAGIPAPTITPAGNVIYTRAAGDTDRSHWWLLIAGIALVALAFFSTVWARRGRGGRR